MTFADEVFEKVRIKFNPLTGEKEEYVYVDDLVDAFLKKNKEIEQELKQQKQKYGTPNSSLGTYRKIEQARAFREMLKKCEELK